MGVHYFFCPPKVPLPHSRVHALTSPVVAREDVVEGQLALLVVDPLVVAVRQSQVEYDLQSTPHITPGSVFLAPVEHQLLGFQCLQKLLADLLNLRSVFLCKLRHRIGQDVEQSQLLLREFLADSPLILDPQVSEWARAFLR